MSGIFRGPDNKTHYDEFAQMTQKNVDF